VTTSFPVMVRALTSGLPLDVRGHDAQAEVAIARLDASPVNFVTRVSRRLRLLRKQYGMDIPKLGVTRRPPESLSELYFRYVSTPATAGQIQTAVEAGNHQNLISAFLAGQSSSVIATAHGIASGTVRGYIRHAMRQAAKKIAGLPRYHLAGRKSVQERSSCNPPMPCPKPRSKKGRRQTKQTKSPVCGAN
jgi:hypothetical protein